MISPMLTDYYSILNVNKFASREEIKREYRRLALKYHPDRNPVANDRQKFQEILEAYQTLIDPAKRKKYDTWLIYGGSFQKTYKKKEPDQPRDKRYGTHKFQEHAGKQYKRKPKEADPDFRWLESFLFGSLLLIGFIAIFLSLSDLILNEWDGINSLTGIIFSSSFTFLLIFSWTKIYRRKD